jgi:hypothetical protein
MYVCATEMPDGDATTKLSLSFATFEQTHRTAVVHIYINSMAIIGRMRGAKMAWCISVAILLSLFLAIQPTQTITSAYDDPPMFVSTRYVAENDRDGKQSQEVRPTEATPVLYVDGLYGPTLTLTESEQRIVARRQQHRAVPSECPQKYLFVNTHTYGRHHNQLQEMMHLAAWAQRLGRTAVLGWFRFSRRWVPAQEFYNFTRIMESYCVITPEEMVQRIGRAERSSLTPTVACLGQKFDDTPLKRLLKGPAKMKCRLDPSIPSHYNTRNGMRITQEYFNSHVTKAQETLLVLSGELAFFLRPGLAEMAALFGLLEPANHVRDVVTAFKRKNFGSAEIPPYFGIHLRRREQECLKEITESREDGGELLKAMDDDAWRIVSTQCAITVDHVKALMASLRLLMDHQPMFLGSDHQDMKLEKALVDRGAVMFGDDGGLLGLSVDFFMLGEGMYFTGNQLSSITQNVCYRRLGRGRGCNGFIPSFSYYHSRNVETHKSYIRSFGVDTQQQGDS